ncbi:MAG: YggT family protein [Candidatus Moranbacteria bacterium]|nr:YggT family protein [Candidatus Moranbacteria bacterium]
MSIERTKPLYLGIRITWYVLGILEALLALRFLLKLMQANPLAGFTNFVYSITKLFTVPFEAVFRNFRVQGSVVEWTTILAMVVYWLIAMAAVKLFVIGKPISASEADAKIDQQDN